MIDLLRNVVSDDDYEMWDALRIITRVGVSKIRIETEDDGILYDKDAIYHLINDTSSSEMFTIMLTDAEGELHRITKEVYYDNNSDCYDLSHDVISIEALNRRYREDEAKLWETYLRDKKEYETLQERWQNGEHPLYSAWAYDH